MNVTVDLKVCDWNGADNRLVDGHHTHNRKEFNFQFVFVFSKCDDCGATFGCGQILLQLYDDV